MLPQWLGGGVSAKERHLYPAGQPGSFWDSLAAAAAAAVDGTSLAESDEEAEGANASSAAETNESLSDERSDDGGPEAAPAARAGAGVEAASDDGREAATADEQRLAADGQQPAADSPRADDAESDEAGAEGGRQRRAPPPWEGYARLRRERRGGSREAALADSGATKEAGDAETPVGPSAEAPSPSPVATLQPAGAGETAAAESRPAAGTAGAAGADAAGAAAAHPALWCFFGELAADADDDELAVSFFAPLLAAPEAPGGPELRARAALGMAVSAANLAAAAGTAPADAVAAHLARWEEAALGANGDAPAPLAAAAGDALKRLIPRLSELEVVRRRGYGGGGARGRQSTAAGGRGGDVGPPATAAGGARVDDVDVLSAVGLAHHVLGRYAEAGDCFLGAVELCYAGAPATVLPAPGERETTLESHFAASPPPDPAPPAPAPAVPGGVPSASFRLSRLWNRVGAAAANGGRDALAAEAYEAALALRPDFLRARVNRAAVEVNRGNFLSALRHCSAAVGCGVGPSAPAWDLAAAAAAPLRAAHPAVAAAVAARSAECLAAALAAASAAGVEPPPPTPGLP